MDDAGVGRGFGVQGSGTIAGRKLVRAWVRMASCCVVQKKHWRKPVAPGASGDYGFTFDRRRSFCFGCMNGIISVVGGLIKARGFGAFGGGNDESAICR